MKQDIILNGRQISYDFTRKDVKNINLRINAKQEIKVSANYSVPQIEIDNFLLSKSNCILKALDYYAEIEKYSPRPKEYVDGESFSILGHDRRLRVITGKRNFVFDDGAYIVLTVTDKNNFNLKKRTVNTWLKNQCKIVVEKVCNSIYPKFKKYNIDFPEICIRNMTSRWGSCQPTKSVLTFNTALIEVPVSCIEYVVTHEFTHFIHPNHSKKFYNQLSMFMPDWKERKSILEKRSCFVE